MSFSFGQQFKVTLFGQSHAPAIGVVIDGLPAGYKINHEAIQIALKRRRPGQNFYSSPRCEADDYEVLSGEVDGYTCGAPLSFLIRNRDSRSKDYEELARKPRPSHADYPAQVKYGGFHDIRGGGQFSGRLTAPLVLAGALAADILKQRGIQTYGRIKQIAGVIDDYAIRESAWEADLQAIASQAFPVLNAEVKEEMLLAIRKARGEHDSVGGLVELATFGLPVGVGEPFFRSVESVLAQAYFSVPGMRGVEFGTGFAAAQMRGSEHNDPYRYEGGQVTTMSNHHGGIIGGLTTGQPLVARVAVKPTSSIGQSQDTVDLKAQKNTTLSIHGRHDPAIVPRALVVLEMMTSIALLDLMLEGGFISLGAFDK